MSRKSAQVPAVLLVAITAALTAQGCGPDVTQVRNCVDSNGYLLPDSYCSNYPPYGYGRYQNHLILGRPLFVYGGTIDGSRALGYSSAPIEGAEVVTRSGTSVGRYSGGSFSRSGSFSSSSSVSRGGFGGHGGGGSFGS